MGEAVFYPKSKHGRGCNCVRCTGFQPGHPHYGGAPPVQHGAYQTPIKLQAEAEQIAEQIRPLMPVYAEAFEGTIQSYAILLTRISRAHKAIEESDEGEDRYVRLAEDMRKWMSSALKHAKELGLTPASAAAILRDTTQARRNAFFMPTPEELDRVPVTALERLQQALSEALERTPIEQ